MQIQIKEADLSCNILHKWAKSREGPESNIIYPKLHQPQLAGTPLRCKFVSPWKVLNWPQSATAQKRAFPAGWNTTSQREQELILCLLCLVFPFYYTNSAVVCAILKVSQGSRDVSKILWEEGSVCLGLNGLVIPSQICKNLCQPHTILL